MDKCLRCGKTGEQLFPVAENTGSNDIVGRICSDCEEDLVWNGIEVGSSGTCGYSESCNRAAAYVTLTEKMLSADSGEVMAQTEKRNNILCEHHFDELRTR